MTLLVSYLTASATQNVRQYQGPSQEFAYTFGDDGVLQFDVTPHERRLVILFRGVQPIARHSLKVVSFTSDVGPSLLPELATIDEVLCATHCRLLDAWSLTLRLTRALCFSQRYGEKPGWFFDADKREFWVQPGRTAQGLRLATHGITNAPRSAC